MRIYTFCRSQTLEWLSSTQPAVKIDPFSAGTSLKSWLNHRPYSSLLLRPAMRKAAASLNRTVSLGHGRPQSWSDTSAFADSDESHISPSIPSMWPQESAILQLYHTCTCQKTAAPDLTDEAAPTVRLWGSQWVLLQSILLPWRHSRPQCSCLKFLLLQPTAWMLCILGDKSSLPRKVTQQASTHGLSWDKRALQGLRTAGYWEKHLQAEKTVEYYYLLWENRI